MEETAYRAVAIVGAGAVLPDARNVPAFWENVKHGRYSVSEVSPDRWDPALYFDPDPNVPGKTYSKIGGWVREFDWDPLKWRLPLPPCVVEAMDGTQKWAIVCTREALEDYGYPQRPLNLDRTAVILGNAMGGERHYLTVLRIYFPEYARELAESASFAALPEAVRRDITRELHARVERLLPEITEDSMPGELANIVAGRIANLFNFHGPNFVTDAACASSMAAVSSAVEGLVANDFDVAITGGVDRNMGASTFVKFCKIGALSATGTRPFAAGADGFVMGEGAAIFVLKRLADAERDGDSIYAVIRSFGGASDGKGKGITAPNPAGQKFAVERAWKKAGVPPSSVGLIEGHGTSTRVGDVVEVECLNQVFSDHLPPGSIALGSVKSNFGHLKGAAGAAGLLKAALALRDKVLPPSVQCQHPNPDIDFAHSPLRVNTELRPWTARDGVRRAGLSAFGFGGTNFHAVLEEYIPHRITGNGKHIVAVREAPPRTGADPGGSLSGGPCGSPEPPARPAVNQANLKPPLRGALVVGASTDRELAGRLRQIEQAARAGRAPAISPPAEADLRAPERIAIDYADAADLAEKSAKALKAFAANQPAIWKSLRPLGIYRGSGPAPKIAFLYTGQGSQYLNMLRTLRDAEPIVAGVFAEADRVMTPLLGKPLSNFIYPRDGDAAALARAEDDLRQTAITQPAVLASDDALTRLLAAYGIVPDMTMGHSLGEYGALVAAGALPFADALEAVSARGQEMTRVSLADNGRMAAVFAPLAEIEKIIEGVDGNLVIANINSNRQAVIGGASKAVEQAVERFQTAGHEAVMLPVSHAFHTSIVAPASEPLRRVLERLRLAPPRIPVVSNVDGAFYPTRNGAVPQMIEILGRQIAAPVQFVKGLDTLYNSGARVFVECGPKKALHGFVEDVLGDRPGVVSLFTNHPKFGDLAAFNQALCGLYAAGLGAGTSKDFGATTVKEWSSERATSNGAVFNDLPVTITGAALGIPGSGRIFDDGNIARILRGEQFIDVIPTKFRRAMLDKNITRLVKSDNGGPVFEHIKSPADVIKLAGRGGEFHLHEEFGVSAERVVALDRFTQLAMAAGIDALRDAGVPLVRRYKTTSKGTRLPDRWELPEALRDDTGIVFASVFPGFDSFAGEAARYYADRYHREQLAALEDLRSREPDGNHSTLIQDLDRRIDDLRSTIQHQPYVLDRNFLFHVLSMGHSQFAEFIGARGPNTQINSACASTAAAISVAQDWIRAGRCRRVIVVSADDITTDHLIEWFGAGFLASGAAATDEVVEDAAVPFDRRRHGMIMGMGAAALVIESAEAARERGVQPICEVVASIVANSAFHGTRLDSEHICDVMERLVAEGEERTGLSRDRLAASMMFMSHETYTPARGGSASAEINSLRRVFGDAAGRIVIANTKGFTGHAMGAGVEEVVAVKALETGCVPPVANFKEVDPDLGPLNLSKGGMYPVEFALRFGAGFGSQISMTLLRWVKTASGLRTSPHALGYQTRIVDRDAWGAWLQRVSGDPQAALEVVNRTLRVCDRAAVAETAPPAAPVEVRPVEVRREPEPPRAVAPATPPPAPAADSIRDRVLAIVSEKTGYPKDMLDLDLDLEADLGVDTVKQAEMFAAIREAYGIARDPNLKLRDFPTLAHVIQFARERSAATPPAPATAVTEPRPRGSGAFASASPVPPPAPLPAPAEDAIRDKVLAIVAEKTGYPKDMLDPDLDLEADLGIDTVKQAEMFAAIREAYGIVRDPNLKLRDFPTLAHVIQFARERSAATPEGLSSRAETTAPTEPRPRGSGAFASALPVPPPTPLPAPAEDAIRDKVLTIVAEKTGYPKDMLDPDLDLEADLGVDTVKQAEMFAAIREAYGIVRDPNLKLRDFPTLAHVIQFARERSAGTPVSPPVPAPAPAVASFEAAEQVPRRVPVPVLRPPLTRCKPTGIELGPGSAVTIVPDDGGVGAALASRLEQLGVKIIPFDEALAGAPVNGVYWLPALDCEGDLSQMDPAAWHEALRVRVKTLYSTMRKLYDRIASSGTFLVSATRLGGLHGYDDAGAVAPLGGAVSGFTKAYKRERPEALVKVVDFEASRGAADAAELLVEETLRDPGAVEIGYRDNQRFTIGLEERAVADGKPGFVLDRNSVFVITGAAGSIVSAITADLAAASGGTFYLLDLAPEPDPANPDLARFVADKDGLKRDLIARLQARGERATPVAVEKELAAIERAQAALSAIQAVRSAGGNAHYFSVNLTDAGAVSRVVEEIRRRSGRIDVLLHAAGLDRSHPLSKKEPAEFDMVFDVKADGWFHLLHAIGDMPLRATVAFSSIAGRFGNAGQTDYSAANDLLSKIASSFRTTRPSTRAIAIDWTAWGGIGMATRGSIPKIMAAAGIDMLPPEAGVPWIRRELTEGGSGGEVVAAQGLGALINEWDVDGGLDTTDAARVTAGPLIGEIAEMGLYSGLTIHTTLDPAMQPFLHDHQIDGTPVLPGVISLEAFAEAALWPAGGWHVDSMEDVNFLAPFKFYRGQPRVVTTHTSLRPDGDCLIADCRLTGSRTLAGQGEPQIATHATAHVRLTREAPRPMKADVPRVPSGQKIEAPDIYRVYFHGPAYQVVERAWWDGQRMTGQFAAQLPQHHHPAERPLAIAPRLIELCFQTAGLCEMAIEQRMGLPLHIDRIEFHGSPELAESPLFAVVTPGAEAASFDADIVDASGNRYLHLSGYRTVKFRDLAQPVISHATAVAGTV